MEDFIQSRLSESNRLILRVTSLVFGILYLNHFVACMWYIVGTQAPSDTGLRWTLDVPQLGDFESMTTSYQYTTTLHWSVSQMTLGAIEITCQNTAERISNVTCLIFGLLFGSTLVSSLSATMVEFQMMRNGIRQRMRILRQYLRDNQVGVGVSLRVQKQVSERLSAKQSVTAKDVAVLDLLTLSLRAELRFEVFKMHIQCHPLFRMWGTFDENFLRRLCNAGLDFVFLRTGDELFVPGVAQDEAYMVVKGKLRYTMEPESLLVQQRTLEYVSEQQWLSEAALWSYWIHVGTAEAAAQSQLLVVLAEGLLEAIAMRHIARDITLAYAKQFHRRIVTATPPQTTWPTDTQVPFTDYGDLVQAMEEAHQVAIGVAAVEVAVHRPRQRLHGKTLSNLLHEVETGKSTVMLNKDGDLERVVSVVALSIVNKDRRVLVQVGKHTGQEVAIGCQLPGGKQERGELAADAAQRMLTMKLSAYVDYVQFVGITRQTELKLSQEYGINTKYLRAVCNARLNDDEVAIPVDQQLEDLKDLSQGLGTDSQNAVGIAGSMHISPRLSIPTQRELVHIGDTARGIFYAWLSMEEFGELKHLVTQVDVIKALMKMQFEVGLFQADQSGKIVMTGDPSQFTSSMPLHDDEASSSVAEEPPPTVQIEHIDSI